MNPAALANVKGLQVQLEGTVVFMDASFVRDCGPRDDCGPVAVQRDYGDGRVYRVNGEGRLTPDEENGFYAPTATNMGKYQAPSNVDGHAVTNGALPQGVPSLWASLNLDTFGLDGFAVGAAFYTPRAGDYAFHDDEYTRFTLIDRNLVEAYYSLSAAWRYRQWIAIGASLQGLSAGVEQRTKLSADPTGAELPDYDITVHINTLTHLIPSGNLGVWSSPLPGLELGASVQLGRSVAARGPVQLESFGPAIVELIDAGAVEIVEDNPTALSAFELPPFYRAGAKYLARDLFEGLFDLEVEADFVYEPWSVYDHVYLETTGLSTRLAGGDPTPLAPIVQPKDWQDAFSVRLGGEVTFLDGAVALRSGAYYETDAIPSSTYSVDLMNGEQVGIGLGGSLALYGVRIDLGYGHAFLFDRVVGDESIVHSEAVAQPGGQPEPRTRIAMGRYATSYDVIGLALNLSLDELLGFGAAVR
ncbi:MAG: OmpP1/FadL family transporter [Myxococcota bacterium]